MKVGFLGLGAMGSAMATNVLKAGNDVSVWNRTAARAEPLAKLGAHVAREPRDIAHVEAALTMFADDDAFRASVFDSGLFEALDRSAVFVNMATVSVAFAQETVQRFAQRGVAYVAAPVLGRPDAATAGKLNILVAGHDAAIARVAPLLDAMGQTWRIGDAPAHANVVKLAANFMIASAIETMAEAFALVRGHAVDPRKLFDVVANTSFAAPIYKNYGAQILEERFDPGFRLVLGLKDVRLALAAGESAHTPLPFASSLRDTLIEAVAAGDGERDWTAIANVARRRAGEAPVAAPGGRR